MSLKATIARTAVALTAGLALATGTVATTGGTAVAAPPSNGGGVVQPDIAWPFNTCFKQNYVRTFEFYQLLYLYDHTDFGVINYYKVYFSTDEQVTFIGWASCAM